MFVIVATSAACFRDKALDDELLAQTDEVGIFGPPHGVFRESVFTCHWGSDPVGGFVPTAATICPVAVTVLMVPTLLCLTLSRPMQPPP